MTSPIKYWNEQEDEILRRLRPDHSYGYIAKVLGRKNNSVLGRAHRLGLTNNTYRTKKDLKAQQARRNNNLGVTLPKINIGVDLGSDENTKFAITDFQSGRPHLSSDQPDASPLEPKVIYELRPGECRFCVQGASPEEYLFCGGEIKPGSSYCHHHHEVCSGGFPNQKKEEKAA